MSVSGHWQNWIDRGPHYQDSDWSGWGVRQLVLSARDGVCKRDASGETSDFGCLAPSTWTSLFPSFDFLPISLPTDSVIQNKSCEICIRAKQTRCSFPTIINKTTTLFEMVHCDLWGPYRTTSRCGSRYFLALVDDYSCSVWLYLLPTKQHVTQSLKNFITMVQVQSYTYS